MATTHDPQRIGIESTQNIILIWLDRNIDTTKAEYQNTIAKLQAIISDVEIYTDVDQCVQFIETIDDRKICMITSGSLGQHIVPRVHDMTQVDSIFIFCGNRERYENWARAWSKIKEVFTAVGPICEALKQAAQQCEHNAVSMSFVASGKRLDQLEPSFMYTQILKEILLTIDFKREHFQNYIDHCRTLFAESKAQLKKVKQLERSYAERSPIWWYSYECFLYPMLNRALRTMNGDIIVQMGFFIKDLHQHIQHLHKEQYSDRSSLQNFTVYRGQGLTKAHFGQLLATKGGLMSFNNFLSTSKIQEVSLSFAGQAAVGADSVGVFFVIKVDPLQSKTPFASIRDVSYFSHEDEVLFSMHSVFRVHDIETLVDNEDLYQVNLSLTTDDDKELCVLMDHIRKESFPTHGSWYRLGAILFKMGQSNEAKQIYQVLLNQTIDDDEKASIYSQLGMIMYSQGEYFDALKFHKKALKIREQSSSPNQCNVALSYNNIGNVYLRRCDYSKALSYHEKALSLRQQLLPLDHPDLAASYTLACHEKALIIRQRSLPANHPELAKSHTVLGNIYSNLNEHAKAMRSYEQALAIQQQSLPSDHSDLAATYNNMGVLYESKLDYQKAASFYAKAVQIAEQSLVANHPVRLMYMQNYADVRKHL
ncbi:unnamed protein product [Adineta ricciae]|uniref:ADP ribosyltransferase domain-containing protein n=1 Tax=Adineta ricciae TaxID=249248 RepID=A0A813XEJ7_ADIRI|nr:unnamed protein product [Adineta ricciae]CAF1048330.1 unnamed protein product [Adineta ricciae]